VEDICGNMIGGTNVGPLLGDADLGTVTVTLTDAVLNLSGDVVDCTNSPVTDGFVTVYLDNVTYRAAVNNGKFSLVIRRCYGASTQAQFIAGDNSTSQQGSMTSLTVTKGDVDAGQLSACGATLDEFINVAFNGNTYSFTNPPDQFNYSSSNYFGASSSSPVSKYALFDFYGSTPPSGVGTFTPYFFTLIYGNFYGGAGLTHPMNMNITDFGPVNGFIIGTLGGSIYDSTTHQVYPLTGSFKIKRAN